MNRRAFLASIFGSAVASALPAPALASSGSLVTSGWSSSLLKPGDRFTIAGVNAVNPPGRGYPIEFTITSTHEFEFDELELSLDPVSH